MRLHQTCIFLQSILSHLAPFQQSVKVHHFSHQSQVAKCHGSSGHQAEDFRCLNTTAIREPKKHSHNFPIIWANSSLIKVDGKEFSTWGIHLGLDSQGKTPILATKSPKHWKGPCWSRLPRSTGHLPDEDGGEKAPRGAKRKNTTLSTDEPQTFGRRVAKIVRNLEDLGKHCRYVPEAITISTSNVGSVVPRFGNFLITNFCGTGNLESTALGGSVVWQYIRDHHLKYSRRPMHRMCAST